jgi:Ca2+-binding EF-hand superfamily protein
MKKKLFVVLVLVFFSLQLTPVFAQDSAKKVFASMDADKDGKVTKEEYMTYYVEYAKKSQEPRFNKLDTNGDGNISRDEFTAVRVEEAEKTGKSKFNRIDANRDGAISEEELEKRFRLVRQTLEQLKAE